VRLDRSPWPGGSPSSGGSSPAGPYPSCNGHRQANAELLLGWREMLQGGYQTELLTGTIQVAAPVFGTSCLLLAKLFHFREVPFYCSTMNVRAVYSNPLTLERVVKKLFWKKRNWIFGIELKSSLQN